MRTFLTGEPKAHRLWIALFLLAVLLAQLSCSRQETKLAAEYQELGKLYETVGKLNESGKYQEAIPLAERALELTEKTLGPEHTNTATCLNNLALLYRQTANYAKAESLMQRGLKIREKVLGVEAADTADSLTSLAILYEEIGKFAQAEPLYERALKIKEKVRGPEHQETAASLINLATFYEDIHNYATAEALCERALKINEKIRGPEHPDTAMCLSNLAELYREMSDYPKAEPLLQRVLAIHEKVLGLEHPQTAASLGSLGTLYKQMGSYAKAETLLQRALQIDERVLGPEHPSTATTLNNLALVYQDSGDYAKAETLLQRALRIDEKVLGPERPNTATSLSNLAVLYVKMADYGKAEPLLQRALRIDDKILGPEHPDTAHTLNNLAGLYQEMGDYGKAEPLFQRALAMRTKVLGAEHPDTAQSLNDLASLYQDIGDYAKAEPLYQRALAIHDKVLGAEHPDTAQSLNNLAVLYEYMGDHAKAEPLIQRAVSISQKVFGSEHAHTATSLSNLAAFYLDIGDYVKAEELIQRALKIREKVLGPQHPDTALSLSSLGAVYQRLGKYTQAEPLFRNALATYQKILGAEHPITAAAVMNLAALEIDQHNVKEARTLALLNEGLQLKLLSAILSFCSEQQRLGYQNTIAPYALFAATNGSDSELALACLRYKGVVLDSIIEDRVLAEASQNEEKRDMVQKLNADKQRLGQLLLENPTVPADQRAKEIQQLEEEVWQIEGKLARDVAGLGQPRRALSVTLQEVQAAIPTDGALIEYLHYPHYLGKRMWKLRYGAIVLTAKGKPRWIPIGGADEIEKGVTRYRSQVADSETADTTLEETLRGSFDEVWAPVEKALPDQTRTVIISPDGQLNFISFATLLTPKDRFLAEDYSIQHVSSGRDLLHDTKLAANSQLIAFGNPDFSLKAVAEKERPAGAAAPQLALRGKTRDDLEELNLPLLPGTKAECAVLAERAKQWKWSCAQFLDAGATEAELRKLRSPHILHLATHGFVLDAQKENQAQLGLASPLEMRKSRYFENPMHRAGLALAGAQTTIDAWRRGETPPTENDGIVTAEEVGALNLEGTWLVTLSACNTGGGVAKSGEGVLGLRRGFVQAGAKNLLMTLWPISDETTVDIMAQFYEAAHKTGNAPQALAEVQRHWLVKLRKTNGLTKAVNLAGAFILSSQGKP